MPRLLLLLLPLLGSCTWLWQATLERRCAGAEACGEEGLCGVRTWRAGDRGWRCTVRSAEDCAASLACREEGACDLDPHVDPAACIATHPSHCRASELCEVEGRCALADDGSCVTSEASCRSSQACADEGRCAPVNEIRCGRGWMDAVTWCDAACDAEGACHRQGLSCLVVSEDHCRASTGCTEHGRCGLDRELGRCVAASEPDCAASLACQQGLPDSTYPCTLRGARCADARSACEREPACLLRGDCRAIEGTCAPYDGACPDTIECLTRGRCEHAGHLCLPMDPSHCESSMECDAFERCTLSSWLVQQCVTGDGEVIGGYGCPGEPCLREGRCLQQDLETCLTPTEAGVEDALPRLPAPPEPTPEPAGPPPVDGAGLRARMGDDSPSFVHALFGDVGGRAQAALLSTVPVTCDELAARITTPREGNWVFLGFAPTLDGEDTVIRTSWGGPETTGASGIEEHGVARLEGERLVLDFQRTVMSASLELRGSIPVHHCGTIAAPTPPRPQDGVELLVRGEAFPVAMALVDTIFDRSHVVLASQPVTCHWRSPRPVEPDLVAIIDERGRVELEGARVRGGWGVWGQHSPPELGATDANDELDVQLAIEGSGSNPSVRIQGRVRAVDCR